MSGVAFDEARDRGLERGRDAPEMLDVDFDAIFYTRDFIARQAACHCQVIETVADGEAGLLNAISDIENVGNLNLGLIGMIESYVHASSLRIMPGEEAVGPQYCMSLLWTGNLICCECW